jgi:hypothetical protein
VNSEVIKVEGPASRLSWTIGRDRSLVVVDRDKVSEWTAGASLGEPSLASG